MTGPSFNIVLTAKHSLEGLSDGWTEDCYLNVAAASTREVLEWRKRESPTDDAAAITELIDLLITKVTGGQVLSTNDDGSTQLVKFQHADSRQVLESLPPMVLKEVMETCVGLARNKSAS